MKRLNLQEIYHFGKTLNPLVRIAEGQNVRDNVVPIWSARNACTAMTREDSPLLSATRRAIRNLMAKLEAVVPADFSEALKIDDQQKITWFEAYSITTALSELESVLGNDMPGIAAYLVSKKGIYDTEALIDHAENHLLPEIRSVLPPQAIIDLREAGKCLAYEVATACAFHLWRAVETVMGMYYERLAGSTLQQSGIARNWGAYIAALKKADADPKVTTFLDHIREEYRNPQTHPEAVVTIGEAQGLFGVAMTSIDQMVSATLKLPASQASQPTPALPQPGS